MFGVFVGARLWCAGAVRVKTYSTPRGRLLVQRHPRVPFPDLRRIIPHAAQLLRDAGEAPRHPLKARLGVCGVVLHDGAVQHVYVDGVAPRLQRRARRRAQLENVVAVQNEAAPREAVDVGGLRLVIAGPGGIALKSRVRKAPIIYEHKNKIGLLCQSGSREQKNDDRETHFANRGDFQLPSVAYNTTSTSY